LKIEVESKRAPQIKIFLLVFFLNYYFTCSVTEVVQRRKKYSEFRDNYYSLNSVEVLPFTSVGIDSWATVMIIAVLKHL